MKIFITGVSKGIGNALVEQLFQAGHEVWGVSRTKPDRQHERFYHSLCDIRNEDEIERVARELEAAKFYPDVVILNAGIEKPDLEMGFEYGVGKEIFETNYFGAVKWVDLFLRFHQKPRQFLAVSSIFALRPNDQSIAYSASKCALAMAFRGMRMQFSKRDVIFKIVYLVAVNTVIKPSYQVYFTGGKKPPFFVVSPEKAARFIIECLESRRESFYSHQLLSWAIRLTQFLPDRLFRALTTPFRRE